ILGSDMPVILDVFNIKGQKVKRLCDRELPRGQHSIQWNGRDADNRPVASGMYFYRLSSPEGVQTRKMMLIK
ncbi:MAG: FlgD immunoglobulin-like domain containing protein, partial [Candidatus Cloacimonetes bacterium]|nr:FlgD immunoglobulin-like domain containing protein [Candidatus Cloacimonadota bacterium]